MIEVLKAFESTVFFLAKTIPIIAIAMFLSSQFIKRGIVDYITDIFSKSNLNGIAIATVSTCFFSPMAAYSMLSQAWKEKRVEDSEVIAISFLSSFPSVFSHLYSFFIPFVIPLLGFAGVVYTLTRFCIAFVKSAIGYLLVARGESKAKTIRVDIEYPVLRNLSRVIPTIAITYFIASILNNYGIFDAICDFMYFLPLNPNAIGIAVVETFNIRVAVVLAANLMDKGLSWKWVIIGLILGNVVSFSARSVRHSLPMHLALFGRLGVKVVILNSIVTLLLDVIFIIIFLIL